MSTWCFTELIVWCWIDQLISLWKYSEWFTCNCHAYCNKAVQWELLFAMATINWICRRWCFALNKIAWVSNSMFQINDLYFTHFFHIFFNFWISFFFISMCSLERKGIKLTGTLGHFVLWLFLWRHILYF